MSIVAAVLAAVLALYAFGCYRASGYFGPFYQWRTREEYPREFLANIVLYGCVSLMLAALAVYWALHGQ